MRDVEALVIGKGPAGIQAAVYMKRGGVNPVVIGKDLGAGEQARLVENFYAFESIGGAELVELGIKQAQALDIPVITDEVVSIAYDGVYYVVKTTQETFRAWTVLLATGSHRNMPRIRKIRNYAGKGVSQCAVCDGFFYRNKTVAVIGSGEYAASEAEELLALCKRVVVMTNGETVEGNFDPRCEFIHDKVDAVYGDPTVEGLVVGDENVPFDGIFIAMGSASSTDLATKLGIEVQNGRIIVNDEMETAMPGLYAAGDCIPGVQQVVKAAADGCIAGYAMIATVRAKKRELEGK